MNTKPKKKRFQMPPPPEGDVDTSDAETPYHQTLQHPEFALRFAQIVTEFEHLEDRMSWLLNRLIRAPGWSPTGLHILRAIKSPRGRMDLMRDLLQLDPGNSKLGEEFDEALSEFAQINTTRNKYVHGRWFTSEDGSKVRFRESGDSMWQLPESEPLSIGDLDAVLTRIRALSDRLFKPPFWEPIPLPDWEAEEQQ